jgi:hypothetical protein
VVSGQGRVQEGARAAERDPARGVVQLKALVHSIAMTTNDTRFAVAVRDGEHLWLFLWLKRDAKGDVYVFWPRDREGWNPHASYHESGRLHHKSYDNAFFLRKRQKPDAAFSGTEPIVTTPIYLDGLRANNKPCRSMTYTGGVFEIGMAEISPTSKDCRTSIAVDIVAPGAPPLAQPWSEIVRQHVFTDALPHISVTLWGLDKTDAPVT